MLPLKRTLGDIRTDIQTRMGFGMSGQAGIVNSTLIDSAIRSAQEQLYMQYDFVELKAVHERQTGAQQAFYDYPSDCNVERITSFSVLWSGRYVPLKEGITLGQRNTFTNGIPSHYERREQLEIYPVPDTSDYTLRFEYIKTLKPLVNNNDRTSIPSELVFLHAMANVSNYYRKPDAGEYASQLDAMLTKIKQRQRKTVFTKDTYVDPYSYVTTDQME
jgi:hypothetical protein